MKDIVGIMTPNCYAICTMLRVFGRGVEALTSLPDIDRDPLYPEHAPLKSGDGRPYLASSPIPQVRRAQPSRPFTVVKKRYVDIAQCDAMVDEIMTKINAVFWEPLGWPFGRLKREEEYLCAALRVRPQV